MPEAITKELTLTRTLNAPRDMVWRAWTDPEQLAKWWGPRGVTNPLEDIEVDLQAGGVYKIVMVAGEELGPMAGQRWPMQGLFQEIDEPSKLVFKNQAVDEDGNVLIDGLTTVTLKEVDGRQTELTVHTTAKAMVPEAEQMIAGMTDGWNQSLDKLVELVG